MTDNSKIEINPSVLQNRSQTYQSLTDVNGADVFTDDYEEKVKDYQQKEQRSYEDTKEQVFIKKMDENAGKEEAVKEQLFLTTGSQQLQQQQQQAEVTASLDAYWIPACGILLAVGILLLLQYRKRRQGRWKKNVAHTYNYES